MNPSPGLVKLNSKAAKNLRRSRATGRGLPKKGQSLFLCILHIGFVAKIGVIVRMSFSLYTVHKAFYKCSDPVNMCKTTQNWPIDKICTKWRQWNLVVFLILDAKSVGGVVVRVFLAAGFLRCACHLAVRACGVLAILQCVLVQSRRAPARTGCGAKEREANDRHLGAWLGLTFIISLDILILVSSPIIYQLLVLSSWNRKLLPFNWNTCARAFYWRPSNS